MLHCLTSQLRRNFRARQAVHGSSDVTTPITRAHVIPPISCTSTRWYSYLRHQAEVP